MGPSRFYFEVRMDIMGKKYLNTPGRKAGRYSFHSLYHNLYTSIAPLLSPFLLPFCQNDEHSIQSMQMHAQKYIT
jgi:hypothetical protein